ncbi:endolytic transglycosylase MltG [Streptomyces sp. ISL-99]|uniref:endolytic transglycosylase MltG n=1 Tax=Streptomyces sp. ISL-99 TaxID=2819193 RepID=UPI001BE67ABF|nr:endolytic transglycosylase MltG [Streptomyces sp. ISL-99]MBT2527332.1 endolytic transglycosylase MltG [Streptomyces sp. ISL-99]
MTEYGRGAGHEPWHPEDPLYGDQGWAGQQAPYGGQPQHYQQEPQQQQPYYDGRQHQHPHQHEQQPGHPDQQQYGHNVGWDTAQQQEPVPYGMNPAADPYAGQQPAYGAGESDYYAAPDAYPPPQPPNQRRAPEPDQAPEWEPEPEAPEEHPFFTGSGDRDDDPDEPRESRRGGDRRGGKSKKKKSRNGTACLFVVVVLAGGVGGISYFGYQFYQDQFGAPADYSGTGTGSVEVEIPKGAGLGQIGSILARKGVVKSSGAFVSAATANPKSQGIQPGVYPMKKEMSGKAAVDLMINPSNLNALIVKEGQRNVVVYEEIDKKLKVDRGTTEDVAKKEFKDLGLPEWANDDPDIKDPLEGFLYPSRYDIGGKSTPKSVLKEMVTRAKGQYAAANVEAEAERLGLESPLDLVTVASLVQVEGKTHDDFRKMGEVVYNRLKPTNTETNQLLQFDSAFNYLKGQSEIKISESEINSNMDPYNTYTQRGLTPGPISNPGHEALAAALNPTKDGWLYFVATDGLNKTEFAKTHAEFLTLKEKFDASQGSD